MHLPALALEEYLKNQLEENPALEEGNEDTPDEEVYSNEEIDKEVLRRLDSGQKKQ